MTPGPTLDGGPGLVEILGPNHDRLDDRIGILDEGAGAFMHQGLLWSERVAASTRLQVLAELKCKPPHVDEGGEGIGSESGSIRGGNCIDLQGQCALTDSVVLCRGDDPVGSPLYLAGETVDQVVHARAKDSGTDTDLACFFHDLGLPP